MPEVIKEFCTYKNLGGSTLAGHPVSPRTRQLRVTPRTIQLMVKHQTKPLQMTPQTVQLCIHLWELCHVCTPQCIKLRIKQVHRQDIGFVYHPPGLQACMMYKLAYHPPGLKVCMMFKCAIVHITLLDYKCA